MNTTLLLMLGLPILLSGVAFYFLRPHFERAIGGFKSLIAIPIMCLPGFLIVAATFAMAHGSAVSDTEIWSGTVTGKNRVHDSYVRTYSCYCTTDSKGNTTCQTCTEDRYTVKWLCDTTIGQFTLDTKDSASSSIYNTPNPPRYDAIVLGEPASRTNTYTNYIQAVPDTLFKPISTELKTKFNKLIPAYPSNIYDLYRIDRFVTVGFDFTDRKLWNQDISNMLKTLGQSKQVNIIVLVVKTSDPMYMYALRDAWEGANKNDVVLLMGSEDGQKIEWVDVISWTKNELFKIQLRDAVTELGVIHREPIMNILQTQISKNFERRSMSEFEYLSNDISPPEWLMIVLIVLLCAVYIGGAWFVLYRNFRY